MEREGEVCRRYKRRAAAVRYEQQREHVGEAPPGEVQRMGLRPNPDVVGAGCAGREGGRWLHAW